MSSKNVVTIDGDIRFPRGFTITDNRVEDELQQLLTPSAYCVWRQYLRFWGSDKKKAYPSLAYLSRVTGLSERTIRKVNVELVNKKFLRKNSGNSSKSNTYFFMSIDSIIKYHSSKIVVEPPEEEKSPPPIVQDEPLTDKAMDIINEVPAHRNHYILRFIAIFNHEYTNKFGIKYALDDNDAKALVEHVNDLADYPDKYEMLTKLFFQTKNAFILESDFSIYLFWRPKIMRLLISEYVKTDAGRWEAQAEKIWATLKPMVAGPSGRLIFYNDAEAEEWIRSQVKFSGANMNRDRFVLNYILNRLSSKLTS